MNNTVEAWALMIALFFGLAGTYSVILSLTKLAERRPPTNVRIPERFKLGYDIILTAGIGQVIIAIVFSLLHFQALPSWLVTGHAVFVGYLLFAGLRALSLFRYSQKLNADLRITHCLVVAILWPLIAILIIPIQMIDLREVALRRGESQRIKQTLSRRML